MTARGTLEPTMVRAAMAAYRDLLDRHRDGINRLNVYPVPDGDTGTNMERTLNAVVEELEGLGQGPDMAAVCKAISHGSLMGARGNSGVILSQLLRGLSDGLAGAPAAGAGELAGALRTAADLARQAVVRPVEGTILSVADAAATAATSSNDAGGDLVSVVAAAREGVAEALARTPEQLPVLADAGVVDAGGTGFLLLFDGLLTVLDGRPPSVVGVPAVGGARAGGASAGSSPVVGAGAMDVAGQAGAGSLRYEVMYLLDAPDETIPDFKEVWAGVGDSIVVVGGDGIWNCHIHTDDIGAAIEVALDAGRPRDIRVTDLLEQVEEERWVREGAAVAPGPGDAQLGPVPTTAVVAVVSGEGIGRIFRSLGVHTQVRGGQSMNPSTAELVAAVGSERSDQVVVLPNNRNIVPVAEQVDALCSRRVGVVPTGSIVEGFVALLAYDPAADLEENVQAMTSSARRVVPAEVTMAVRDARTAAGDVRTGDWIGVAREGVIVVAGSVAAATMELLDRLLEDEHELVTLIEGEGATAAATRHVTEWLHDARPGVSVEVHHGGQPLYPYLLGIE